MSDTVTTRRPAADAPAAGANADWQPSSPFVDRLDPHDDAGARPRHASQGGPAMVTESPFLTEYDAADPDAGTSPQSAELYAILAELRDREFDDVVYQLQSEAYDLLAPRIEGEDEPGEFEMEQFFERHFAPLARESDAMLDQMAGEMERHDIGTLSEPEIDRLLDRFEPVDSGLSPSFEGFLKKLFKKAKKAVKKVAGAVKKGVTKAVKTVAKVASAPIAIVLKKLKSLVRPLLSKVLKSAIDKLPEPLQDAARQAAAKLFGERAKVAPTSELAFELVDGETAAASAGDAAADEEIAFLQAEFDLQIANLVLADDETTQDLGIAEFERRARRTGPGRRRRLHCARRKLAKDLGKLGDDDDATPAVEQFIPALLPVLKLGLKLIGRKRVVSTIAGLIGGLLRPFVGPKMSTPLANAIVGTGLKLVGLELSEDGKAAAAAGATAAVVEDTVRELVELPAEVFEDEILLEAMVEHAFERALAGNLPPMPRRPELVSRELPGSWLPRNQYKRFEPPKAITISQQMANGLTTFGGGAVTVLGHSLASLVGRNAQVRLYEAVSGTWLSKISRDETDVSGLGGVDEIKWRSIHPLTSANAALLIKDAGMANDGRLDPRFLRSPHTIDIGQRFFYIEVPGLAPRDGPVTALDSAFYYIFDCPQKTVTMTLFLSEADAQSVAASLRKQDPTAAGKALATLLYNVGRTAISNDLGRSVDIRKEAIEFDNLAPAAVLVPLLRKALMSLLGMLMKWAAEALFDKLIAQQFTRIADDPADGVTIRLVWSNPAGMELLCRLLNGKSIRPADVLKALKDLFTNMIGNMPRPSIEAGFHRE